MSYVSKINGYDIEAKSYDGTLPIANGGTGATTAAAALSNLGGCRIDLLWENQNWGSSFSPQQVNNIPCSNYDLIMIDCAPAASNPCSGITLFRYKNQVTGELRCYMQGDTWESLRAAQLFDNNIYFGAGNYCTTNGAPTQSNSYCIPRFVYGIKGVN